MGSLWPTITWAIFKMEKMGNIGGTERVGTSGHWAYWVKLGRHCKQRKVSQLLAHNFGFILDNLVSVLAFGQRAF